MKTRMFFSLLIATLLVLAVCEAQAQSFVKGRGREGTLVLKQLNKSFGHLCGSAGFGLF